MPPLSLTEKLAAIRNSPNAAFRELVPAGAGDPAISNRIADMVALANGGEAVVVLSSRPETETERILARVQAKVDAKVEHPSETRRRIERVERDHRARAARLTGTLRALV